MGFSVAFEDERNVYFKSKDLTEHIAIFQSHKEFAKDKFDRYRVGFHHLAFRADKKETVDEFYEFLKKKKVVITEKPQHYPDYGDELYYAVFFNDPDGLRLELFFEINNG